MKQVFKWYLPDEPRSVFLADPDDWDRLREIRGRSKLRDVVLASRGAVPEAWGSDAFWDVDMPNPPCISADSKRRLEPRLADEVQFIPAHMGDVEGFLINPLVSVFADSAESAIIERDGEVHVLEPAFSAQALGGLRVFTVDQETYRRLFFTDLFLGLCDELGLQGFTQIELVWDERDGPVRRPQTAQILKAAGITPPAGRAKRTRRPSRPAPPPRAGVVVEQNLDPGQLTDYLSEMDAGLASIGARRSDPDEIAALIDARVEELRSGDIDRDTWLQVGPLLGPVLGEQIVRRYGWSWTQVVSSDTGETTIVVASPDRGAYVQPMEVLLNRLVEDGAPVISVFIACKNPAAVAGARPGQMIQLG